MAVALGGCSSDATSTAESTPATASGAAAAPAAPAKDACAGATSWRNAGAKEGQTAFIEGPVKSALYMTSSNGDPTFLNVGVDYPNNNRLTVVIWGDDRGAFPKRPEVMYDGETICVRGRVQDYNGVSQIEVSKPSQIIIAD